MCESCPLTKLNGGLSQLHSADEVAIAWLTNYARKRRRRRRGGIIKHCLRYTMTMHDIQRYTEYI